MPKKQAKVASVELYLNECYPCHQSKYLELYDWYHTLGLSLRNFQTNRIVLSREWLRFAREVKKDKGIDAPFVVVTITDGKQHIYSYEDFMQKGVKMFSRKEQDEMRTRIMQKPDETVQQVELKRKTKTKKTNISKKETISTDIES